MTTYVLDTFALMAYFQGEPAGAVVETLLGSRSVDNSPGFWYINHRWASGQPP